MLKQILLSGFLLISCQLRAQHDSTRVFTETDMSLVTPTGQIQGTLCLPVSGKQYPVALIIAGSGPTDRNGNNPMMKNNSLLQLAHSLAGAGIASLRYDKRGIAASTPAGKKEIDLRFDDMVQDAASWADTLKKDPRFSSLTIIGHSEGSLIGMLASAKADKYISIAGPGERAASILHRQLASQPAAIRDVAWEKLDSLDAGHQVKSFPPVLFSLFRPSVQPYLISWFRFDPSAEISKLTIPVLIIQGTADIQVGKEDAERLFAAQPKAKLAIIDNMNHVLKTVEGDQNENIKSYSDPTLPVNENLTREIISFILKR